MILQTIWYSDYTKCRILCIRPTAKLTFYNHDLPNAKRNFYFRQLPAQFFSL